MGTKKAKQRERKRAWEAHQKALRDKYGYTRMQSKGLSSARPDFPDLSTDRNPAPLSHTVGNGPAKPPLPPDAKKFPVGNSHKQGLSIILPKEVEWMGGKKT